MGSWTTAGRRRTAPGGTGSSKPMDRDCGIRVVVWRRDQARPRSAVTARRVAATLSTCTAPKRNRTGRWNPASSSALARFHVLSPVAITGAEGRVPSDRAGRRWRVRPSRLPHCSVLSDRTRAGRRGRTPLNSLTVASSIRSWPASPLRRHYVGASPPTGSACPCGPSARDPAWGLGFAPSVSPVVRCRNRWHSLLSSGPQVRICRGSC